MNAINNFRVDLGGVVELLSRNLYSGPRVFVRELLQNGVDAITARTQQQPDCPARMRFITDGRTITITDSGIGLSAEQAQQLLSTIGASSKRDEWGMSREDYLGQFGIGLLSCFMVAPTITVYSRSLNTPDEPIRWEGHADGTWTVATLDADDPSIPASLPDIGTAVVLHTLPGERYAHADVLEQLVREYGTYLPISISVERAGQATSLAQLHPTPGPWDMEPNAQAAWCATNFGFMPFAAIPLEVKEAGIRGVGFVLAAGANPGQVLHHRVYLQRMLLTTNATDLLPEWAYFVRVVLDTELLKPTASREQLFADELLDHARHSMGQQVRTWLANLATHHPDEFARFTALHVNGLKALAVTDPETRTLVARTLPYRTSQGMLTLDEVIEQSGTLRYVATDSEFRTLEPIAAANGLCIVNAGFAFDEDLLGQLALDRPRAAIRALSVSEVLGALSPLSLDEEAEYVDLLRIAAAALDGQDVTVAVRSFAPSTLPVLYLPAASTPTPPATPEDGDVSDLYSDLAAAVDAATNHLADTQGDQLILNAGASIIYEMARAATAPDVITHAVRGLYVQALLAGRHPMDTQVRSWSTSVFSFLISRSLTPPAGESTN